MAELNAHASDDFDVNRVEFAASDEEAWTSAEAIGTYKAYLDYYAKYYSHNGKYLDEASNRMQSLLNTIGIAQFSEGSEPYAEYYFHGYKSGETTAIPEKGTTVIALVDSEVSVSVDGETQTFVTIKEDQVAEVRDVQVDGDKVYILIEFHQN